MIHYLVNGKLTPSDKAYVHVHDLALLRGYAVFDFFRLEGSTPLFIEEHIERFYNSASLLRLAPPIPKEDLKEQIEEMLTTNKIMNSGVRIVLTGGNSPNGYDIGIPNLFVLNEPIERDPNEFREEGIALATLEYKRELAEAKTINYVVGIHHREEVVRMKAFDTLFTYQGHIYELTRSNFFIIDGKGHIITADKGILKGINRNKLIEACREKYIVEERPVKVEELETAKEAFITGTTKKVIPVTKVGEQVIGEGKPGHFVKGVQRVYDDFVKEYVEKSTSLF